MVSNEMEQTMKQLITGGCSFSECLSPWIETWPKHLESALSGYVHIPTGMGSQGNGLISRRIIYQIVQSLKKYNPNDLLVGIMWSGPSRHDVYFQKTPVLIKEDGYMENPTKFVPESNGSWTIMNHSWLTELSQNHYRHYHDMTGQYIYSNEHVLRTQWFLKLHNIKYFMTTYTNEVFQQHTHPDTKYLYEQIDFDQFLPVEGEYEWCRDHSGLEFPREGDNHPSSDQHRLFTEQVILPFLKEKKYI
jgi:hypothetical protein